MEEIHQANSAFIRDELPKLIKKVAADTATVMATRLRRDWKDREAYNALVFADFEANLYHRWGKALSHLHMMLEISREIGANEGKRLRRSRSTKDRAKRDILLVTNHMRQRSLRHNIVKIGPLSRPVFEGATEAMDRNVLSPHSL